ncbi:Beta-xylosidase [Aquisphaera giovannonii]|uniref:Beta-xylosidase n=1 Tax=Aquisphaera giovannonii TaxID=406548 RepID=A0A5B9WD27_9BACT|nr:family 43 glycosylhydrolase [Aquisphaera giovannonii]QEH38516.1 Beta-xylosidase [Aquisphaera giovannonii]
MKTFFLAILAALAPASLAAQDNGDGTYTNPPLHADYPDPDIIRVGDDFYFASTTFANSPGLVLLHSKDLVNWETVGHVMDRLDGDPKYDMKGGNSYRNGVFAPSLRYHKGTFHVAVTPNGKPTRIYHASDIRGPWKCDVLKESAFDPGLLFDDDGTPYLFTCGGWDGHVTLKTLSPALDRVVASRQVFYVRGIEGSKAFKIDGWYYLFNSLPGRLALMCSRARKLDGPWETIKVLDDRAGGHQGAIVDLPGGGWYGFVMRDSGPIGRVTNICPITWKDGWPLWGEPEKPGRVPPRAKKPIAGQPEIARPISTGFDGPKLPLDWSWNHNPDDSRWSLSERPGFLRLRPTAAPDLWHARNSLTHKGWGPSSCAVATLDVAHLRPGDVAGLGMIGKGLVTLAVQRSADGPAKLVLSTGVEHGAEVAPKAEAEIGKADVVHLALRMDFTAAKGRCGYSLDGKAFTAIGGEFPLLWDWRTGTFQGEQYAVFCYNPKPGDGYLDVDGIRFESPELKEPAARQAARPASEPDSAKSVAFESFSYSGTDPMSAKVGSDSYLNPILAGFYPDPSVCRVGDDFYLVNSSFLYFPGLPVFHSRDLVHWEQVGNAIQRPSQAPALRVGNVSGGMFAPTIRHHGGRFHVICTQVGPQGGNFVVSAERPEGPWSEPTWLRGVPGIDPSLFFDEGHAYVVFNAEAPDKKPLYEGHRALWLQQVDLDGGKLIGPRKLLVNGGTDLSKKPIWIEGPHLLRKDGWYILIAAEGGTGPAHSEVVFRSRDLAGPYVPYEKNPILTQRDLPRGRPDPITCTGHADLVELPNGDWWAVFLGCRPDAAGHGLLGRETFLLPVKWADGWPAILEHGAEVPRVVKRPALAESTPPGWRPMTGDFTATDDFDGKAPGLGWMGLRTPTSSWWSLDAKSGEFRLMPRKARLTTRAEDPSFLCRRLQHASYTARTAIRLDAGTPDGDAGLVVFQDEGHHLLAGVRVRGGQAKEAFVERVAARGRFSRQAPEPDVLSAAPLPGGCRRLEIEARGEGTSLTFRYRADGGDWSPLGDRVDATFLDGQAAGGFTGVCLGVHARTPADGPAR